MMSRDSSSNSTSYSVFWLTTVAATVGVVTPFVWLWVKRGKQEAKKKPGRPPHPEPCHWLWGNAAELPNVAKGEHLEPKILAWAKELQTTVLTVKLPRFLSTDSLICVGDAELAHAICVSKQFPKAEKYQHLELVLGKNSLILLEGDDWKRLRKTFATGFTPTYLQQVATPIIWEKLGRFLSALDNDIVQGKISIMMEHAQTFTADVIVQFAFGEDWGESRDEPTSTTTATNQHVRPMLNRLTLLSAQRINDPIRVIWDWKLNREINELERNLNNAMEELLQRRLDDPDAKSRQDICSIAIQAICKAHAGAASKEIQMADDEQFKSLAPEDRKSIIDQLKTFYFAGHDTTASTISWAAWLLAQNPGPLARLREELSAKAPIIQKMIITENGSPPSTTRPVMETLQECTYLAAVLNETLRMYPPGSTARMTLDENETWNGYSIGGKSAFLYISPYVMQRLPQNFQDPDIFEPERWLDDRPGRIHNTKAFMPFLKGPRDCIGKYFAMLEAKIAVASLAMKYDMECINPNDTVAYRLTAIPSDGCKVRLSSRANQ